MYQTFTQNVHDTQSERRTVEIKTKSLTQKFIKLVGVEKARAIALDILSEPVHDKNGHYSPSKFYNLYFEKFQETKAAVNTCACGSCQDQKKFQNYINVNKVINALSADEVTQYKRIRNNCVCKIQGL